MSIRKSSTTFGGIQIVKDYPTSHFAHVLSKIVINTVISIFIAYTIITEI